MTMYDENAREFVQEIIEMSENNMRLMQEAADNEKGDNIPSVLNKRFYSMQTYMEARFALTFITFRSLMNAINVIESAVNKLPNRHEFEEVKAELHKQVNESLRPSQEDLKKLKEVIKRGEKGGMYG